MWFTRISIHNPVFATMMMLALLVLGLFSYHRLHVEQFPSIDFPIVVVTTDYPGAAPEVVEQEISKPIEEVVNTISGINTVQSRSYPGSSVVIIEFALSIDAKQALQDVREKIATVRPTFRSEIKEPKIVRFNPDEAPVISLAVQSKTHDMRTLTNLAEHIIKKRLETIKGVGAVRIIGGTRREITIHIKPAALAAHGISLDPVVAALRYETQDLAVGSIETIAQEKPIEIRAKIEQPQDYRNLIVASRQGQPIRLEQVADILDGQAEQNSRALIDGLPALAIDITKNQNDNIIETVAGIRAALPALSQDLPKDIDISVIRDTSKSIQNSVTEVKYTLIEGAVLTIIIVFLFLASWRSTLITGLTLPIAVIGAYAAMFVMGFSLNVLTLMALSLTIGLLVDDAIVIRENIVRHVAMGKTHYQAALDGTQEIGLAVLATTFSIVAVFLPVGFMGGIIGRFFHQFGLTVVAAVMLSLFVSFTLDPMLSSLWHDPDINGPRGHSRLARCLRTIETWQHQLAHHYQHLIAWALDHRKTVIGIAVAAFVSSLIMASFVGKEFVPKADLDEMMIDFYTPPGSSLSLTEHKVQHVNQALHEFPEVEKTYANINTEQAKGKAFARVFVKLYPRAQRARGTAKLEGPIRQRLQQIAGITITNISNTANVNNDKTILISLEGPQLDQLDQISQQALDLMRHIPGIVDIDRSLKAAKPVVTLNIDRAATSDVGISLSQLSNTLYPLFSGDIISTWRAPDNENYDVRIALAPAARESMADIANIPLATTYTDRNGQAKTVPLGQFIQIGAGSGATQINHKDLHRAITLSANVNNRAAGDAANDIMTALNAIPLPTGYRFKISGATKDMQESMAYAAQALLLAIIFIYMILASQFRSFAQPITIMMTLPLSLIGVFTALLLWHSTLNIFSIIGCIMLMGLVTKNAILLIDFTNQRRQEGLDRRQALIEAGGIRLRPILMTTLAMIVGMLPLAFSTGSGAEQRAPMAHAIIGGVIASSLLTLVVIPVTYTYIDDIVVWLMKRLRKNGVVA